MLIFLFRALTIGLQRTFLNAFIIIAHKG